MGCGCKKPGAGLPVVVYDQEAFAGVLKQVLIKKDFIFKYQNGLMHFQSGQIVSVKEECAQFLFEEGWAWIL